MTAKLAKFSAVAVLFALLLPQAALADLWGCVFTNGSPCTWVCFETDLTCADVPITNTGVQQCVDCPITPGGGVGLPGALAIIHPDFDGIASSTIYGSALARPNNRADRHSSLELTAGPRNRSSDADYLLSVIFTRFSPYSLSSRARYTPLGATRPSRSRPSHVASCSPADRPPRHNSAIKRPCRS